MSATRKGSPDAPPLRDVEFKELQDAKGYRLVVTVMDEQPEGTYCGYAISESDNAPVGTIEVKIVEGT